MRSVVCFIAALCIVAGCRKPAKKGIDWSVTLDRTDTIPYGTELAYNAVGQYFPDATVEALPRRFRYTSIADDMRYSADGATLLVAVGLHFRLSDDEMDELLRFVRTGNEAVIFCSVLDEKLEKKLAIQAYGGSEEYPVNDEWNRGDANVEALALEAAPGVHFGHNGRDLRGHFIFDSTNKKEPLSDTIVVSSYYGDRSDDDENSLSYDDDGDTTVIPEVLGRAKGKPNFLRYAYGAGHLTVHVAPLVLTNYFLLQGDNRRYLDGIWSSIPSSVGAVYWHEYFKRTSEASSFGMLWRHPATRWALLLSLLALALYVLFESKRRQRVIPIVAPLQNTSVAFVETVGRLYFDRGDHANMAGKMAQHFLEWVRNTHGLPTTDLNDVFAAHLARKSGRSEREAKAATFMANEVRVGNFAVTEEYIHRLYAAFQPFYDSTHS